MVREATIGLVALAASAVAPGRQGDLEGDHPMSPGAFWVVLALVVVIITLSTRWQCRRIRRRCDHIIRICVSLLAAFDRQHPVDPKRPRP